MSHRLFNIILENLQEYPYNLFTEFSLVVKGTYCMAKIQDHLDNLE